ncbi:hypothetical protein ASG25_13555 [Rhizobium sp. Leaf384]|uniref:hypothetical protein n=1 Tax=unclassified Rhizobium TaxID=2613769 RepID=UPI000714014A|nr:MULTISPECIES: hypothetical protein [unclassified Rhizobium]KQR75662.1 hypothetical protein ASG03_18415 [Rhizobium sp. Leaf341]KQS77627.1 hypothetical protein ASG25_13555 [Rhizobium sp. Leaf384]KQS83747.1 hypothetical protein ASG58_21990 [Rhizobium sp. Leaf383]
MFLRTVDWPRAVAMVADIAKGTASVTLRTYSRKDDKADAAVNIYGWAFHQIQAFGESEKRATRLVDTQQLTQALLGIATPDAESFTYEVESGRDYAVEAQSIVKAFGDVAVTVVSADVGKVSITWFTVVVRLNSDLIHWKMQYHERDIRLSSPRP